MKNMSQNLREKGDKISYFCRQSESGKPESCFGRYICDISMLKEIVHFKARDKLQGGLANERLGV